MASSDNLSAVNWKYHLKRSEALLDGLSREVRSQGQSLTSAFHT